MLLSEGPGAGGEWSTGEALISGYENEKRTNHCEPSDHLLPYWYGDGQRES